MWLAHTTWVESRLERGTWHLRKLHANSNSHNFKYNSQILPAYLASLILWLKTAKQTVWTQLPDIFARKNSFLISNKYCVILFCVVAHNKRFYVRTSAQSYLLASFSADTHKTPTRQHIERNILFLCHSIKKRYESSENLINSHRVAMTTAIEDFSSFIFSWQSPNFAWVEISSV